jgi:hypothetical protein
LIVERAEASCELAGALAKTMQINPKAKKPTMPRLRRATNIRYILCLMTRSADSVAACLSSFSKHGKRDHFTELRYVNIQD